MLVNFQRLLCNFREPFSGPGDMFDLWMMTKALFFRGLRTRSYLAVSTKFPGIGFATKLHSPVQIGTLTVRVSMASKTVVCLITRQASQA